MGQGTYRRRTERGVLIWNTERLWALAATLPVVRVPLKDIPAINEVRWFNRSGQEPQPTCHSVAIHAQKIFEADVSHPIILASDGDVMDGMHRIAKALQMGLTYIDAVRFEVDPAPDEIEPAVGRVLTPMPQQTGSVDKWLQQGALLVWNRPLLLVGLFEFIKSIVFYLLVQFSDLGHAPSAARLLHDTVNVPVYGVAGVRRLQLSNGQANSKDVAKFVAGEVLVIICALRLGELMGALVTALVRWVA